MLKLFIFFIVVLGGAACYHGPAVQGHLSHPDSCKVHISCPMDAAHTDLLLYSDSGTRPLLYHCRAYSGMACIPMPAGDALLAAISNLSGELNTSVLGNFDRLESMGMPFAREDPEFPVMSGLCSLEAYAGRAEINLSPLLCSIEVPSIESSLDHLLEDPVLFLCGVNAEAGIFRSDGFHPSQTLDSPESLEHPGMMVCEIPAGLGRNVIETSLQLHCYPNDDAFPGTQAGICGTTGGELKEWRTELGNISRGELRKYRLHLSENGLSAERIP